MGNLEGVCPGDWRGNHDLFYIVTNVVPRSSRCHRVSGIEDRGLFVFVIFGSSLQRFPNFEGLLVGCFPSTDATNGFSIQIVGSIQFASDCGLFSNQEILRAPDFR